MSDKDAAWRELVERRRALRSRLTPPPMAWSADGRQFGYQCAVDHAVVQGDFVTLTLADGSRYLGQVLVKEVLEGQGTRASLPLGDAASPDGDHGTLEVAVAVRRASGEGTVLAHLDGDQLALGSGSPFDEAVIERAPDDEVARYLDLVDAQAPTFTVGAALVGAPGVPARLRAAGFNRHTFVCGQSGSGKTFSLGVMLERIIAATDLRVVVLDPNGDFVRIHRLRSADEVDRTRRVPAGVGEDAAVRARFDALADTFRIHTHGGEFEPTARLADVPLPVQAAVLRLDPLADRDEYAEALDLLERVKQRTAPGQDAWHSLTAPGGVVSERLAQRVHNLRLERWGLWARGRTTVVDSIASGARTVVADLGSLDTDDERRILAIDVLEHLWDRRAERIPTVIVIDEAHTVAPAETDEPLAAMARDLVVRIAGEGRKFGLYLVVASQRPAKVHPNVLTQCDNAVLLRMNALADVDDLVHHFSYLPESLVRSTPRFAQGEALVGGPVVHGPSRIRFGGRYTQEGGSDLPTSWADVDLSQLR